MKKKHPLPPPPPQKFLVVFAGLPEDENDPNNTEGKVEITNMSRSEITDCNEILDHQEKDVVAAWMKTAKPGDFLRTLKDYVVFYCGHEGWIKDITEPRKLIVEHHRTLPPE